MSSARTLVAAREHQRVLHGAYVHAAEDVASPLVRAAAVRAVLPPDAVLSHRSALWVLGEDVLLGGLLDVTCPRGRHLRAVPGLRVFSAALPDRDLVGVGGLLAVSASRAVVDVARREGLAAAVAFGDRALRTGAAVLPDVLRVLDEAAELRGVRRARVAVGLLDGRSESWKESELRVALWLGGLRGLDVQLDVWTASAHVGRADLHLDGAWLEYDGRKERLLQDRFVDDRRRQTRIAEAGYQLRRFTSADVPHRSPADLAAEVRRAVVLAARGDRSSLVPGRDTLRPPRLSPLPTLAELATPR